MTTVTAALVAELERAAQAGWGAEAHEVAKHCLLDWLGVTLAARDAPLAAVLVRTLVSDAPAEGCSLLGQSRRARLDDAALINGAQGHALDFDDVILGMGHPTAPVAPAALALAEASRSSGAALLDAFIFGIETECRIAQMMGPSHYGQGWHGTGTFGTFGAMAASGRLLGLSGEAWLHGLGLAGAQAAGLKSMFGSMTKPLQAGRAAQAGLLAARLAAQGFTSDPDVLGSEQGFAIQSRRFDAAPGLAARSAPWVTEALFKHHAACYLTHNAIEAASRLRRTHGLQQREIASALVRVGPGHLKVCNIAQPATGLECKFSLRMTTALALSGEDTGDEALYSDVTAVRADLVDLCRRITVEPTATGPAGVVSVHLTNGRSLEVEADVGMPERDLVLQWERIERKFLRLATPALGARAAEVAVRVRRLEAEPDIGAFLSLCA